MVNGKEVVGYALGGTEFYSISENNTDGSISFNGQTYEWKTKTSGSFACTYDSGFGSDTTPYGVSVDLNQSLSSDSALTLKDLINKKEKIRLTVVFHNTSDSSDSSLDSGIIDLSKPDSNGHFNFQWIDGSTSTNTYCYSDSIANKFRTCSDAISAYSSSNYDSGHMTIIYPDES